MYACALGARAVFVGRPSLWGLAHNGEEGVFNVLQLLKDELKMAMQLSGVTRVEELKPNFVRTAHSFQAKL
jgi:(S)-2-hydroxy-acid oxidase